MTEGERAEIGGLGSLLAACLILQLCVAPGCVGPGLEPPGDERGGGVGTMGEAPFGSDDPSANPGTGAGTGGGQSGSMSIGGSGGNENGGDGASSGFDGDNTRIRRLESAELNFGKF